LNILLEKLKSLNFEYLFVYFCFVLLLHYYYSYIQKYKLFEVFDVFQIVIFGESKVLFKSRNKCLSAPMRTNHLLILNLALADFLMGVYLIILGIAGAVYYGTFERHENAWRSSTTCQVMGALVVISSETSVLTMVFLSSVRLYSVMRVSYYMLFLDLNISEKYVA